MLLKAKRLDIETGANVAIFNIKDCEAMGIHAGDRVEIKRKNKSTIAIVNISETMPRTLVGITKDLGDEFGVKDNEEVSVSPAVQPSSLIAIRERLNGRRLDAESAYEIIRDIVSRKLDKEEITAFVVSLHIYGIDLEEAAYISDAMVRTGSTLNLNKKRIFDKHSIGGVPGDKTSMLVVPIVAAAGLTIPKTSSRAITSAAGTADRAEVLMPVTLSIEEIRRVVDKTNGCLVWGGAVHLAPADDILIKAEYPFSIDPFLLPSILSKKKAVGSTDLVLDVPIGNTMKVKNEQEGKQLVKDFAALGKRLGINVEGALTNGTQPVGIAIGAAAEAREALEAITGRGKNSKDLIEKATSIAGILLEMSGKHNGKKLAMQILESGRAEKKLREIIEAQGGDPKVKPEDIEIGDHATTIYAKNEGKVLGFDNIALATAVKLAGAPVNKKAALILNKKLFDNVKKGEPLFTLYSDSAPLLNAAEKYVKENMPVVIGDANTMLLKHVVFKKPEAHEIVIER